HAADWLQAALADPDRVLGRPGAAAPESASPAAADGRTGCAVVVDVAREGRRFAGRRAGAVVRGVGDRLADRLPPDARVRYDETDALSVSRPGWDRVAATEWMHRTLPGLFEDFGTDEDMAGLQLRAAVHDADGVVGAQILQRLDQVRVRRGEASADGNGAAPARRSRRAADGRDREEEGAPSGIPTGVDPLGAQGSPVPDADAAGRHDAAGRTPFRMEGVEVRRGSGGRRHRRGADDEAPESEAESEPADAGSSGNRAEQAERQAEPVSTEGLGIADLLAGALAAYRGI
ncbi:hypothetical protein, partial [Pseudonocardia nigra]|uniref:hypothetical protein n=1 Tax=Pseudonocardia nigra TaxID=1921578 RepID=UPI001C5D95E3